MSMVKSKLETNWLGCFLQLSGIKTNGYSQALIRLDSASSDIRVTDVSLDQGTTGLLSYGAHNLTVARLHVTNMFVAQRCENWQARGRLRAAQIITATGGSRLLPSRLGACWHRSPGRMTTERS